MPPKKKKLSGIALTCTAYKQYADVYMLYLLLHFGLSGIALTCTAYVLECAFALLAALLVLYLLLYLYSTYCFTSEEYAYALLTALLQSY